MMLMAMLMKITDDDDFRETFVNGQCNFRAFLASSSEAVDSAARGGRLRRPEAVSRAPSYRPPWQPRPRGDSIQAGLEPNGNGYGECQIPHAVYESFRECGNRILLQRRRRVLR